MILGAVFRRVRWPTRQNRTLQVFYRPHSTSNDTSVIAQAREKLSSLGEGEVTLVKDDVSGIATITLQHERRMNALSGRMMVQLMDITEKLQDWDYGKAVILCAEGETFCSGGDLTTVKNICNPNDGFLMSTFMHEALLRIYSLPFITVCLVHGKALGGGAELTTVTDYRVFTETGVIQFVQGKMGVITGWGGGTRLVKLLGFSKALKLLSTCQKLDGTEAMALGLADHLIDSKNRENELNNWLSSYISHESEVIQAMKRVVVGARDLELSASMLNERLNFAPLWGGPANLKALGQNIKHN